MIQIYWAYEPLLKLTDVSLKISILWIKIYFVVKQNMKSSYDRKEQLPKMIIDNSLPYIGHLILCCQNI